MLPQALFEGLHQGASHRHDFTPHFRWLLPVASADVPVGLTDLSPDEKCIKSVTCFHSLFAITPGAVAGALPDAEVGARTVE